MGQNHAVRGDAAARGRGQGAGPRVCSRTLWGGAPLPWSKGLWVRENMKIFKMG